MNLRIATSVISVLLHALLASPLVLPMLFLSGNLSMESGSGEDTFTVEQGIAIEGIAKLGDAEFATEAVEAEPVQMSEARPEIKEIKTQELVEENKVLTSEDGPEQEELPEVKPEPVEQPRPAQVATVEQVEQQKVEELQSSGQKKEAGTATERSQYLGKLRIHLEGKKVNPRSQKTGIVVVKFSVDSEGAVLSREVTMSSGSPVLDNAALASVQQAAPFPPMPDALKGETIVVSVPFRFSVR